MANKTMPLGKLLKLSVRGSSNDIKFEDKRKKKSVKTKDLEKKSNKHPSVSWSFGKACLESIHLVRLINCPIELRFSRALSPSCSREQGY